MNPFHFTELAFRDVDAILAYIVDRSGIDAAYDFRSRLFEALGCLAETPGLGHRRPDLTSRRLLFFTVTPYLVIFEPQTDPLTIQAVLHSARDIKKILRRRPI